MSNPSSKAPPAGASASEPSHGFYRSQNWCRENSFGYLMRRIMQVMVGQVDRRLETLGLTQAQWSPLFLIGQRKASTLAELSRELHLDAGALTRTLDRLELKGLCRRERSTEDRRVVHLALTPEGEAAMAPVPQVLCEISNRLLDGFTDEEWQTLMHLLRKLQANAEVMREHPTPDASNTSN
jgi:DNA-binding MarR family transcriptional regulator